MNTCEFSTPAVAANECSTSVTPTPLIAYEAQPEPVLSLPVTGADSTGLVTLAALLVVAGYALLRAARPWR